MVPHFSIKEAILKQSHLVFLKTAPTVHKHTRFDSWIRRQRVVRQKCSHASSSVEQLTRNQSVAGANPAHTQQALHLDYSQTILGPVVAPPPPATGPFPFFGVVLRIGNHGQDHRGDPGRRGWRRRQEPRRRTIRHLQQGRSQEGSLTSLSWSIDLVSCRSAQLDLEPPRSSKQRQEAIGGSAYLPTSAGVEFTPRR